MTFVKISARAAAAFDLNLCEKSTLGRTRKFIIPNYALILTFVGRYFEV